MKSLKSDYYKILKVPKKSTKNEIKKQYYKLALKYHPDKNKSKEAEEKFKRIPEAYYILSDPNRKKKYDTFRKTLHKHKFVKKTHKHNDFLDQSFNPFYLFNLFMHDFDIDEGISNRHAYESNKIKMYSSRKLAKKNMNYYKSVSQEYIFENGNKKTKVTIKYLNPDGTVTTIIRTY